MEVICEKCGHANEVNPGALLGGITSKRKARASKRNAKLGGWKKGRKRGPRKDANQIAHGVVAEAERRSQ